ncbi:MAG: PorT family protein, partial [Muribaculaceae bacterium]|nr:PorT family protein [Muribaculaceae bacterium]
LSALIAIISIFAASAFAQFRPAAIAAVNIGGLNFNQDIVSTSHGIGYQAGILGEMMFPGIGFGVDLGLLYNQAGAKVNLGEKKVWSSLGYGNERARMHYVQIPFHLRFKWTRLNGFEDYFAPFAYGGPEVNILLAHGKCKAFDYNGVELGLSVGLGVEIMKNWQVSGGYTWGVTSAMRTKLLDEYIASNRTWTVRVAYFFKH